MHPDDRHYIPALSKIQALPQVTKFVKKGPGRRGFFPIGEASVIH